MRDEIINNVIFRSGFKFFWLLFKLVNFIAKKVFCQPKIQ